MKVNKSLGLTQKILIALVIGIVVGTLLNLYLSSDEISQSSANFINVYLVNGLFGALGTIFLNCIRMLTIPIVFFSIMVGASQMGDMKRVGKIGSRTLLFYLATTAIAICIAIISGYLISPGVGVDMTVISMDGYTEFEPTSLNAFNTIISVVPTNIFVSLTTANMLQIIFFALIIGIGMTSLGDKVDTMRKCANETNDVLINVMIMVMNIAPIGVFGLLSKTFATVGLSAIIPLGKYFFVVLLALFLHLCVTYFSMLKIFVNVNPIQFLKNAWPAMAFAFSTSSSSATIPVTLDNMQNSQGVDPSISSFTIPIGATINMDGTAIMQGVAVVLIAQIQGVDLTLTQLASVVIMATIASIGTASVPSAGLVMLAMVLQGVGLDPVYIGVILGVDRLLDMTRTALNVAGDEVCTIIIANMDGKFDRNIFYEKAVIGKNN